MSHEKCFLGGLSYSSTDESLMRYFAPFGEIEDVHVVRDNQTGASRGFGFIRFVHKQDQDRVVNQHEHMVDGRKVMARDATPRRDGGGGGPMRGGGGGGGGYNHGGTPYGGGGGGGYGGGGGGGGGGGSGGAVST